MSFFKWTQDLELGIEVIDEQHKRIVDYINDLHDAIELNNKEEVLLVVEKVVDYTYEHFSYEEALLQKSGYHLTDPHIIVHDRFKNSAKKMQNEVINSTDMVAAKKMRSTLTLWLTNHIKKEDVDYAASVGHLFRKKTFLDGVVNFFSKK